MTGDIRITGSDHDRAAALQKELRRKLRNLRKAGKTPAQIAARVRHALYSNDDAETQ